MANCVLYAFMDFLSMAGWIVVLFKPEHCHKPFKLWYTLNGLWATFSFFFIIWWVHKELKHNF